MVRQLVKRRRGVGRAGKVVGCCLDSAAAVGSLGDRLRYDYAHQQHLQPEGLVARAGGVVGLPQKVSQVTLVWEGEVGAHLLRCKAAGQKDLAGLGEWVKRNVFK